MEATIQMVDSILLIKLFYYPKEDDLIRATIQSFNPNINLVGVLASNNGLRFFGYFTGRII